MNENLYDYIQDILDPIFARHDWYEQHTPKERDLPSDICHAVYDLITHDIHKATINGSNEVNRPQHYTQGGIETIDVMESKLSQSEFKGFLKGNVLKYITRANLKGKEEQDIQKAQWYLNRLVQHMKKTGE